MHLWMHKTCFFCFIIFEECIYECMWIFWIKIHAWMHEFFLLFDFVLFVLKNAFMNAWNFINFLNENVCLNAWIFSFSWMIMHILKHEIIFFIFIFLNDNAWNSIFLYVQIFKWFYKWWFFFSELFKDMFQKDMYEFSEREDMYKRYFHWFSNIWKFMYKGIFFNDFLQCLFKMSVQRFFQIYIYFMYIQKGFFQWFFFFV